MGELLNEMMKTATSWDEVDQSADQVRRAGKSLSKTKNQVFNNIQDRHEVFNEYMADALNRIHSNGRAMSSSLDGDNNGFKHGSGYNKLKAASERAKTNRKSQHINDMLDALRDKPVKQKEKPRFQTKSNNRYRVLDRSTESLDDMMGRVNKQSERRFGDSAFVDAPYTEVIKNKSHGSGDPKHLDANAVAQKMINEGKEKFRKIDEELASKKLAIKAEHQKKLKDIRDNSENAQKEILAKSRNRRNKMIGLGAAGIGAAAGGAYLYNRYKKKKQAEAEAEKTAGLLDGLKNMKGPIRQTMPKAKQMSPLQDALNKAKYDAYNEMLKNNLTKKAFISQSELEKLALLQKIPQPKYNMFGRGALEQANSAPYKPLSLKPLKNNFYTGRWKEIGGDKLLNNAKQKVQNFTNPIPPPVAPAAGINPNALQGGAEQAAKQGFNMGKNFKLKAAGIGLAAIGTAAYLGSQRKKRENMNKYSASEYDEEEKIAVTKEEKEQLRRMTGMAKRKIKKQKPNKTKESTYRMKKQKKHADFTDTELEKMASLMADQFIAASALSAADSENMNLEEEIIAGYKAYIDEVNA